jgi:hypothetical protein
MATRTRSTSPRGHRQQRNELTSVDEARPLVVRPLVQTDRLHNADDIDVDDAAIAAGVEHGGAIERRAQSLHVRGAGGRKPSGSRGRHRDGRATAKRR